MKVKIVILLIILAITFIGCSPQPVSIESIYICESISENNSPSEEQSIFPAETKNIYLSVKVKNITPEDELKVIWTYLDTGDVIEEQISKVDKAGSGYISFNIHIAEGFPSGNYKADVYLNGELIEELDFSVQ